MSRIRVFGIGQPWAGDDGVGVAVAQALAGRAPAGVEVLEAVDPSRLADLLEGLDLAVVADAVLDDVLPGTVRVWRLDDAANDLPRPVSTHGMSVLDALALGRLLLGARMARRVALVGIAIDGARRGDRTLSPAVAAAVEPAASEVLRLLEA